MRASSLAPIAGLLLGYFTITPLTRADVATQDVGQLVDEGVKLRAEGRDADALVRFETAYRLARQPRALAQIAMAEQALGRWALAYQHLSEALAHRTDAWITQYRRQLEDSLRRIDGELGHLDVASNVRGATVVIDERPVGIAPLAEPQRTPPGSHVVRVQAMGYAPSVQTVDVKRGAPTRVVFELVRAAPQRP